MRRTFDGGAKGLLLGRTIALVSLWARGERAVRQRHLCLRPPLLLLGARRARQRAHVQRDGVSAQKRRARRMRVGHGRRRCPSAQLSVSRRAYAYAVRICAPTRPPRLSFVVRRQRARGRAGPGRIRRGIERKRGRNEEGLGGGRKKVGGTRRRRKGKGKSEGGGDRDIEGGGIWRKTDSHDSGTPWHTAHRLTLSITFGTLLLFISLQNKTYHVFLLAECFPDQFLFQARYLTVPIIACINFATNG